MKITLVMVLAAYYDWLDVTKVSKLQYVALPVVMILIPVFLVLGQPDLGTGLLLLLGNCAKWLMPLLMQQILLVVEGSDEARVRPESAWMLAIAVGLCTAADFLCSAHYTWLTLKAAWHVRQSLVGLLFSKVTR